MRFPSRWAGLALAALGSSLAQGADPGSAVPFADHDVVCFIGDSITHLGEYPEFVELFYASRFPERSIEFYDCGISGDRASTIMARAAYRVDSDILGHHPTVATILLGANDVERGNYGIAQVDSAVELRRQKAGLRYREAMTRLIDRLQASGVQVTLLTPSIYDDTVRHPHIAAAFMGGGRGIATGANAALGQFADWERTLAVQRKLGLADVYAVMNEINRREQQRDPDFTLVSMDRLHPAPPGHFVMAYALLKAQHLEGPVAELRADATSGETIAVNGAISGLRRAPSGVEFDAREESLPLALDARVTSAVPFGEEFNRELLAVGGLAAGSYRVSIDGVAIGIFSAAQLASGVNLADNPATPQHAQAAAAAAIAARRMAVRLDMRAVAQNKYAAAGAGVDVNDLAALRRYAKKAPAHPDVRFAVFVKSLENPGELERRYAALGAELYQACQPRTHHFMVEAAPPPLASP